MEELVPPEHATTIKEDGTLLKYSGFDTYLKLTSATFMSAQSRTVRFDYIHTSLWWSRHRFTPKEPHWAINLQDGNSPLLSSAYALARARDGLVWRSLLQTTFCEDIV